MRLAYFHTNHLLTGLYKTETEIRWKKDDIKIKKQTDIHGHGPKPSSNSSQPPNPLPFHYPLPLKVLSSEMDPVRSIGLSWRERCCGFLEKSARFFLKPSATLSLMTAYRMSLISAGSISLDSTFNWAENDIHQTVRKSVWSANFLFAILMDTIVRGA